MRQKVEYFLLTKCFKMSQEWDHLLTQKKCSKLSQKWIIFGLKACSRNETKSGSFLKTKNVPKMDQKVEPFLRHKMFQK